MKSLAPGLIVCMLAAVVGEAMAGNWAKPAPIPREQGLHRSQIHRGGGAKARPDNTLETFLWCWGHGMAPEADARLTKDGVAVANHDGNFARVGRGISKEFAAKPIKDLAWDEIRHVDVGSYLAPEYSTERVPTMESVFAAMKGHPDRLLYVDEKGAPPELIAALAEKFGVIEQVYYCSSDWKLIPRWRTVAPKGRSMVWLGAWPEDNSPESIERSEKFVQTRLDEMAATGFDGIDQVQIHVRTDLSKADPFCPSTPFMKRAIALLHKYGVTANTVTWTEGENPEVYRKLWEIGFDHFTTDYPYTLFPIAEEIRNGKAGGQRPGSYVSGRTVREPAVFERGEEMVFEIEAKGFEGLDLTKCELWWTRTGDDGRRESGRAKASGKFVYRTSLDYPGFVRLYAELRDGDGRRVPGDMNYCDLGAGVEIEDIRTAVPPPPDFREFWEGRKALLAKTPWRGREELVEIESPSPALRLYQVKVPCAGKMPVTGYLSVPKAEGKYPICTFYHGYNQSFRAGTVEPPKSLAGHEKEIWFSMTAHGFELGRERKYYEDYKRSLMSNGREHGFDPVQNADPLKPYYHDLALRVMRGLEFLKSRPEWDGKNLKVTGGSQGGMQSVWAAALDHDVTEVYAFIPWNCDIGGETVGRNRGTWYVSWVPALGYYDTANLATLIPRTCTVDIHCAGLGDYICPPTGVMAFFNNLDCRKSICWLQNTSHGDRHEPEPQHFRLSHPAGSQRWRHKERSQFRDKRFGLALEEEVDAETAKVLEDTGALFVISGKPDLKCGGLAVHTPADAALSGTGIVREGLVSCDGSACRMLTAADVVADMVRTVASGSNYVLAVETDGGKLDPATVRTLKEVGEWFRYNLDSIQCCGPAIGCRPSGSNALRRVRADGGEPVLMTADGCVKYVHFLDPKVNEFEFESNDDFFEAYALEPDGARTVATSLEKTAKGWKVGVKRPAGMSTPDLVVKLLPRLRNPFRSKSLRISVPSTGAECDRFCGLVENRFGPDGIDTLFLEFSYRYRFASHPECAGPNSISEAELRRIVACCRKAGIRPVPLLNTLGHQSWRDIRIDGFLKAHPECDETPELKQVTDNYCRSFCPRHETVRKIIPDLIAELMAVTGAKEAHIGADEVFELARCERCRGTSTADIFAEWVNFIYGELKARGMERMYLWGDRLLPTDPGSFGMSTYGEAANGTETALWKIQKDIVICDWHYEARSVYPSVDRLRTAGFRQIPAVWCGLEATRRFVEYAEKRGGDSVVGLMLTTWGTCASAMDAIEGRPVAGSDTRGAGEVYRAFGK